MQLIEGFRVGHWTDAAHHTGCTVVLCPPKTVASCEVRGSSPGTREVELLSVEKKMGEIHAILLTGGSAYGLAAADGVMRWLEERGVGYRTPWGVVPIVPTAVMFDLNLGSWTVRPDAASGRAACGVASATTGQEGNVGAGCGATVGKWGGIEGRMKGGFGISEIAVGEMRVQALTVVNAVGDVVDVDGRILAGARDEHGGFRADREPLRPMRRGALPERTNTTLAVVLTNARLSKVECFRVAQRMHDGYSRAIVPVHTSFDGDAAFALSSGEIEADLDVVAEAASQATASAIRRAVLHAAPVEGIPSAGAPAEGS